MPETFISRFGRWRSHGSLRYRGDHGLHYRTADHRQGGHPNPPLRDRTDFDVGYCRGGRMGGSNDVVDRLVLANGGCGQLCESIDIGCFTRIRRFLLQLE